MDGNPERRKLGVYKVGYQLFLANGQPAAEKIWSIVFDRNPPPEAVKIAYAKGSKSGPTGETIFNYIATNRLNADGFGQGFLDTTQLNAGQYTVRVFVGDYFGNISTKDIPIEVIK
jgi:5-hydroxyisourate hydrolase-like protein (transthyretin family)